MSEWQPIETAPRNGTVIELQGPSSEYPLRGCWLFGEWRAEKMTYRLAPAVHIPDPTMWRHSDDRLETATQAAVA